MPKSDELDMSGVLELLEETRAWVQNLNGQPLNVEGSNNKELMQAKSQTNKQLLYAAHLADLTRAELMNQYHRFKGEHPPTIEL